LIVQHLRTAVPRPEILFVTRKKALLVKQAYLTDMFRKASKRVCTSTIIVPHPPVSYSTCFSYEDPENTKEDPGNPKQAVEGDIQIEYCD